MNAPVVIFAYNRPHHLKKVLDGLAANPQAEGSFVYLFCDGPRNDAAVADVRSVRQIAQQATGFLRVEIVERDVNFGLARSIVEGVGQVCGLHGRAIVLEDDVVPTPFFLSYVNAALDRYEEVERVVSVGCHTFDSGMELPETFFLDVPDCWGWGVWKRSWDAFEPDGARLLADIRRKRADDAFDFEGTYPYTQMLADQVSGRNASWAVRWYARTFLDRSLVLYPRRAVTRNIGFDGSGAHSGQSSGYVPSRLAEAPVQVLDIPLECDEGARETWKRAFRGMMAAPGPSLLQRLKSRYATMLSKGDA